jgi:hypothetical protein
MKNIKKVKKFILLFSLINLYLLSFISTGICENNVSQTRVIPALSYLYYSFDMQVNDKIDVDFNVIAGGNLDIDVWVVDSANYDRLSDGDSFSYLIRLERYIESNFQFEAQSNGIFYVVFSNAFSIITSKTVEIDIEFIPATVLSDFFTIFIILGVILGGVIIATVFIIRNKQLKKKKTMTNPQQHETLRTAYIPTNMKQNPTDTQLNVADLNVGNASLPQKRFCSGCGEPFLIDETNFCSYCGKKP